MDQYKIGEVKKILGIGADAIRYYEKRDLLKPERAESGSRLPIWKKAGQKPLRTGGSIWMNVT